MNGFDLPSGARVVVAMSGGVDSSVAAALCVEAGYEVVGLTMQLYDNGSILGKKGACCAGQDIYDARQVADTLGFPHYILPYEDRFNQGVIQKFAEAYSQGYTPIPCITCNQTVKFKDMLTTARELGAVALVTGHYVQRLQGTEGVELHRALEDKKDQSYFLFGTTREQLEYLRFPLGGYSKAYTRELAQKFHLKVSEKPDSQDICFVPDGSYASLVSKLRPGTLEPGEIIHQDGRVLGSHKGIIHYTVGQRRGLGLSSPYPLYVIGLDPSQHRVIVGPYEALAQRTLEVSEVNWIGPSLALEAPLEAQVKIRSTRPGVPAWISLQGQGKARVCFKNPEHGVAPGQACVFYQETRVLGGGWIGKSL